MIEANGTRHPLSTILAGTDLSDAALVGVQAAHLLARASGASLHVLFASEEDDGPDGEPLASTLLEHHVRHVVSPEDPVALHVAQGTPFRVLTERGERFGADLIVLGSHRPRRAFDGLLGTTADRVLRTTLQPVLVANRSLPSPPRRIVVATDLSAVADRALEVAVDWAGLWGSGGGGAEEPPILELLHVSAFAHPAYRPTAPTAAVRARAEAAAARAHHRVRVRPRILSAPLAPEGILRAAEELHADLVLLGTHGHGGLMRTLIGSVASEVARTLSFPILLVPPE
jgi:nucleotide-binding universal stress UspA family protein